MQKLMTYIADKGSVVINGICFSNRIGDGEYEVLFANEKPADIKPIAWVDLRDCPAIHIWRFDWSPDKNVQFTASDLDNALAIELGFNSDGDLIIWKLF